jgi:hypothetical protein
VLDARTTTHSISNQAKLLTGVEEPIPGHFGPQDSNCLRPFRTMVSMAEEVRNHIGAGYQVEFMALDGETPAGSEFEPEA